MHLLEFGVAVVMSGAASCAFAQDGVSRLCTWRGAGGDNRWSNPANWEATGDADSALPTPDDTAVFPADGAPWRVELSGAHTVTNFVAAGAVTLTGGLIYTGNVEGDAPITLAGNAGFHGYEYLGAWLSVSADVNVTGTGNKIEMFGDTKRDYNSQLDFSGSLSGDGEISLGGIRTTSSFSGDWRNFAGTVNIPNDGIMRNDARIETPLATSSNAVWNVWNSNKTGAYILRQKGRRYFFGALNGTVNQLSNSYNNWLEVGALGIDCAFGGKIGGSSRNHIAKVGRGSLVFNGSMLGNLEIAGGTFVFGGEDSMANGTIRFTGEGALAVSAKDSAGNFLDPSPHLKNSADFPICFSNEFTEVHTWVHPIDSSNAKGIVKRGQGTLILCAPPECGGFLTVEGGSLVISNATLFATGELTESSVDMFGTATLVPAGSQHGAMAGATSYEHFADALAACLEDPSLKLTLLADVDYALEERIDVPPGSSLTFDLGGHRIATKSQWFFNVGDASLRVANGRIDCAAQGFYINDGALALENCDIVAAGRVVQIRGCGSVEIAADARLETTGDDPVVFAIGGLNGKASVKCSGTLVQKKSADGSETTAYCIAGNPNDSFGADFVMHDNSGTYITASADSCIHHPAEQNGTVSIRGGWFSIDPREWLARQWGARPEIFDGLDGWRVFKFRGFTIRIR